MTDKQVGEKPVGVGSTMQVQSGRKNAWQQQLLKQKDVLKKSMQKNKYCKCLAAG